MKIIKDSESQFDDCECEEIYEECKPKKVCYEKCCVIKRHCGCSPKPGKSLLACGRGSAGPLPILGGTLLGGTNALNVGSVTIDTSELCNPTVLLNFNIIINSPVAIASNLTFSVVKCCDGCTQPVGESFTFSQAVGALSSQSFNFQICDQTTCCECTTYTLQITNATLAAAGLSLRANISALAVENIC